MKSQEFKIEGMSCGHCVKSVEIELAELKLSKSEVSIGEAKVEYDESAVSEQDIVTAIQEAGFKVI